MPAKTKSKSVQENLSMSRKIPNNGFLWLGHVVNQNGENIKVEAVIDANGIQSVTDLRDNSPVNLEGLRSLNRKNVLFIPESLKELWHCYGFTKKS